MVSVISSASFNKKLKNNLQKKKTKNIFRVSTMKHIKTFNWFSKLLTDFQALWAIYKAFCLNSGNAKLKLFGEQNHHWCAKVWWFCLIALLLFICISLMTSSWHTHTQNPITLVLADKLSTVSSIPFPAVTICPAIKISAKQFNITAFKMKYAINWPNSLKNITSDELVNWNIFFNFFIETNFFHNFILLA